MKPNKIPYQNQRKVHDFIVAKLKKNYLTHIAEAYIIGSLVNGTFGTYETEHEGYGGSDIDVVVITEKINPTWKYKGEFYNWHTSYLVGEITIKKTVHPINYMIPFNTDLSIFLKVAKKKDWKMEKIK